MKTSKKKEVAKKMKKNVYFGNDKAMNKSSEVEMEDRMYERGLSKNKRSLPSEFRHEREGK